MIFWIIAIAYIAIGTIACGVIELAVIRSLKNGGDETDQHIYNFLNEYPIMGRLRLSLEWPMWVMPGLIRAVTESFLKRK